MAIVCDRVDPVVDESKICHKKVNDGRISEVKKPTFSYGAIRPMLSLPLR